MAKTETESKKREKGIYSVTIIGGIVNVILVILKFIAGILGNSAAMVADAVHSLSDFATDVIVIVFVKASNKPQDNCHKYGHGKFETLATFIIGFLLMLVGIGIAYSGAADIISVMKGTTLESPGMLALTAALISIAAKEILYQYTAIRGKKLGSDAVVANAWHHRSDAFSSIGTALGIGGAIFLGSKWTVLDPIAALVVSVIIIVMAFKLMKPAIDELMERSLSEETQNEIAGIMRSFENVSGLHNLYTRKIGNCYAIEFHIRMDGKISLEEAHKTITDIETVIKGKYGCDTHVMIHMEPLKADNG